MFCYTPLLQHINPLEELAQDVGLHRGQYQESASAQTPYLQTKRISMQDIKTIAIHD